MTDLQGAARTPDGRILIQKRSTGAVLSFAPEDAARMVELGIGTPVSEQSAKEIRDRREAESLSGRLETLGRGALSAGAGALQSALVGAESLRSSLDELGVPGFGIDEEADRRNLAQLESIDPQAADRFVQPLDRTRGIPEQYVAKTQGEEAAAEYMARERMLAEANPFTYGTGEAIGQTLALAPTGLAGGAGGAAAAAAARLGLGKVATGALVAGAAGAAEGAVGGVLSVEDRARLEGSAPATAEQLVHGGMLGLALGAGGGAILGAGAGALQSRLARKAAAGAAAESDAAETAARRAIVSQADAATAPPSPQSLEGRLAEVARMAAEEISPPRSRFSQFVEEANVIAGADREVVREMGALNRSPAARAMRDVVRNAPQKKAQAIDSVIEAVSQVERGLAVARRHTGKAVKLEDVAGSIPESFRAVAFRTVEKFSDDLGKLKEQLSTRYQGSDVARKYVKAVDDIEGFAMHSVLSARTADEAFVAMDEVKRAIGNRIATLMAEKPRSAQQQELRQLFVDWLTPERGGPGYAMFKDTLEDAALVGEVAAAKQAKENALWSKLLAQEVNDEYYGAVLKSSTRPDWSTMRPVVTADVNKIAGMIDRVGRFQNDPMASLISRRLEVAGELLDEIPKHQKLTSVERAEVEKARAATMKARDAIATQLRDVAIINKAQSLKGAEGLSDAASGFITGAGLGTVGAFVGGIPGAVGGLALGTAAGLLRKPYTAALLSDPIADAATKIFGRLRGRMSLMSKPWSARAARGSRTTSGALKAASSAARTAAKGYARIAPGTAVRLFVGGHGNLDRAYESRVEALHGASQSDYGATAIANAVPGLASNPAMAGLLSAKVREAIDYLISKEPSGLFSPSVFEKTRPAVSKVDKLRFARIWAAVIDPRTVLLDARNGSVTPDQIEALRVVYPETYQMLRSGAVRDIFEANGTNRYTLAERRVLDSLLDLGGSSVPGMSPAVAEAVAASRNFMQQQQQQRPRPRPPQLSGKPPGARLYQEPEPWVRS